MNDWRTELWLAPSFPWTDYTSLLLLFVIKVNKVIKDIQLIDSISLWLIEL